MRNDYNKFLIFFFVVKEAGGTSMQLRHHLKSKHKVEVESRVQSRDPERFKCTYCGRIFKQNQTLQDHINTHTGKRPYACNYCDKTFMGGSAKYDHEQHVHLGKKRIYKVRKRTIKLEEQGRMPGTII